MQEGLHISSYKSIKFREVLDSLFGQNQKVNYYARYDGEDAMGYPQLTGYEDLLGQQVLDFFKMRIMAHYPMGKQYTTSFSLPIPLSYFRRAEKASLKELANSNYIGHNFVPVCFE